MAVKEIKPKVGQVWLDPSGEVLAVLTETWKGCGGTPMVVLEFALVKPFGGWVMPVQELRRWTLVGEL